ncbi:inovirus-type Gp2 protein [Photobacterium halotolerans]|uniref:inovirus Gp2 family protein n=1 Tax=Photobacterium halotolerans TaxID=265726 RepID=UPI0013735328|nr:inovirus Gp2 family protein [Photobacterium halotolerans]NAX49053.1 inovirus-type Gp2 protein [Photobacterium halotolerans]
MKENTYNGLPIQGLIEEMNTRYLDSIISALELSLEDYSRTYAIRVDLRLPNIDNSLDYLGRDEIVSYNRNRTNLMKRFMESLNAKIKAQDIKKRREGKRVYSCTVRYAWAKERDTSINEHYHIVLFLNKDRFYQAGSYRHEGSLASLIIEAWASALGVDISDSFRLVHFPRNHGYYLNEKSESFSQKYSDLFYRLSYLAKKRTKCYGEGTRCFGSSYR